MVEGDDSGGVHEDDGGRGADPVAREVCFAERRFYFAEAGIILCEDFGDVGRLDGGRRVDAFRDVAVVLRGRDNFKALLLQALNDWYFGFAIGAPVRPEE